MNTVFISTSLYPNIGNDLCRLGACEALRRNGFSVAEIAAKPTSARGCRSYRDIPPNVARKSAVAIVVVAGLLHRSFAPFWNWVGESHLPIILWGVGGCWENKCSSHLPPHLLKNVKTRVALAIVRDELSAMAYGLCCHIGVGPEVSYISQFDHFGGSGTLNVTHDANTTMRFTLRRTNVTNNVETDLEAAMRMYQYADIVVTERLHGAYIAATLGIPLILIPWDLKIIEFAHQWRVGRVAWTQAEMRSAVNSTTSCILRAKDWTADVVACLRGLS